MGADDIQARRKALRQEYAGLYEKVAAILFEEDPVGIYFEHNTDEYEPETGSILPRLKSCKNVEDVRSVVHEEFVRWFGNETAGPRQAYEAAARHIWGAVLEFRGSADNGKPG